MKAKVFVRILSLFILVQILIVGTGVVASANNCKDTAVTYNFVNDYIRSTNGGRVKTDYSHSYQKCTSAPSGYSYISWVDGANSEYSDVWADVSRGHRYTFTSGTTYWMLNWVKESGYSYACMMAKSSDGRSFTATALWSPDSV